MKKNLSKVAFVFGVCVVMTSCYTTGYIYNGNVLDDVIGQNKNDILRTLGVPDRTMDDGKNGSILIYEQFTQTTISKANVESVGKGSTVGAEIYGYGGSVGASSTQSRQSTSANGISQTYNTKSYRNLYLNQNNIAYDYQTNFGAKYTTTRCLSKPLTWLTAIYLFPIGIPIAIITINKAKKKGEICD